MPLFRSLIKFKNGLFYAVNNPYFKREISTIFALSSGYGKCGVAVIRVSGPDAADVVKRFGKFKMLPEARKSVLRRIRDPFTNEVLDRGLLLWFPGPKSFTGEDCCEFHVHGSVAVISAILSSLERLPNLRLAEPGEFTKRAFYAGKLDLTAVEGLNDLINSETEYQRKQALNQMEGSLFHLYSDWKKILTKCLSDIEAYIDFGEDENIDDNLFLNTRNAIIGLQNKIKKHLKDGSRGERLRSGVNMAILGAPNVGKSSLFNRLCKRPAAIVSPLAGTTRDLIRVDIDIGGYPVVLTDTAGIRIDTLDQIEIEGVSRARKAACDADLILLVIDSENFFKWLSEKSVNSFNILKEKFPNLLRDYINSLLLENNDEQILYTHLKTLFHPSNNSVVDESSRKVIVVLNKIDLVEESPRKLLCELNDYFGINIIHASCKTEDGMESLTENIISVVTTLCGQPSVNSPCYTQIRHKMCLIECITYLNSFLTFTNERDIDLGGHNLRMALHSLGKITGHVSIEEILDKIFADFCIGK